METKKNKVVEFVKNHKKQIAIAAGMVAVGGLMIAKTRAKKSINYIKCKDLVDVKAACSGFDKVLDAWEETMPHGDTWINVVIEDLPAYKIEQAVEAVMRNNKDVKPDTVVSAVVGFKVG